MLTPSSDIISRFTKVVGEKNAITDPVITLHKATHIDVTGTHAYVVWPTTYSYKQAGKPTQHDGIITFALEKSGGNWLIADWIWSKQ